jgi:hypothetical protein
MLDFVISANAGRPNWHSLTILMDKDNDHFDELPKICQPLSYLKYLTLTLDCYQQDSDIALTALQSWMLPSLTHLTFHFYLSGSGTCVKDAVEIFGKQLIFLAFTGWEDPKWGTQFESVLEAAPNLQEFVFSPFSSRKSASDQLPSIKHTNIYIVGFPEDARTIELEDFLWYSNLCMETFPSLSVFRITGVVNPPDRHRKPISYNNFWVRRAAMHLKDRGIRLEDRSGRDLWEKLSERAEGEADQE